jgi:hypothetical protein
MTLPSKRSSRRLLGAPFAVSSDGLALLNVAGLVTRDDPDAVLRAARGFGGPIFIGVALSTAETQTALLDLDDTMAEVAAWIAGQRQVRRGGRRQRDRGVRR